MLKEEEGNDDIGKPRIMETTVTAKTALDFPIAS